MKIVRVQDIIGTEREVSAQQWTSRRLLLKKDGMGFSFHETIIPAGTEHNVINTSQTEAMRLYTLYTPPEHPDGIVHATKAEADEYEKQHHAE